ncbi:DNA (cytosine-5)-methyltransferase 1 [Enterococcus sp. AZ194]|uniref:DNA cytosine methyltransferase n=1 Tax=Enterococcus sp. AZ194 TaxID=2774629 RepID=UPI003F27CD23
MIQILEFFGGIGSPRIALRNMGIPTKSIDYVEIDQKAVDSYNAIFIDDLAYKTQSVVDWNLKPDILIHGSPCQDNSMIGKRAGMEFMSGTRSSLMWETLEIIKQMGLWKPRVVIWENVPGVLKLKKSKGAFAKYLNEMKSLGYTNSFKILNAMDFGLPQNRNRVFCISTLQNAPFNFDSLRKYEMRSIQEFLEMDVHESYTITAPSMLKVIGKPQKGFGGYLPIIDEYCWTITTKQNRNPNSGIIPLGDGRFRLLTEKECWLLQGYTDSDFMSAATVNGKTALYHQSGNSIPVTIFESIFERIL